jgi:hypothetical protein
MLIRGVIRREGKLRCEVVWLKEMFRIVAQATKQAMGEMQVVLGRTPWLAE